MLAIIPARAGSKGVPGKNVRDFVGKPLIQWTLETAQAASSIDEILISTDDPQIFNNSALASGCDLMIKRPASISQDDSPAVLYIKHALDKLGPNCSHQYFCILQPTSPLRIAQDIDRLYEKVIASRLNCGVTVVQVPHNFAPESLMTKRGDRVQVREDCLTRNNLRQNKKQYLARNGAAVYICKVEHFLRCGSLFDNDMAFLEMPMLRSIDIDTKEDFKLAELIKKGIA